MASEWELIELQLYYTKKQKNIQWTSQKSVSKMPIRLQYFYCTEESHKRKTRLFAKKINLLMFMHWNLWLLPKVLFDRSATYGWWNLSVRVVYETVCDFAEWRSRKKKIMKAWDGEKSLKKAQRKRCSATGCRNREISESTLFYHGLIRLARSLLTRLPHDRQTGDFWTLFTKPRNHSLRCCFLDNCGRPDR